MKKLLFVFTLALFAISCNSVNKITGITPSETLVTENRETGDFSVVDAYVPFTIKLIQADKNSLTINAPENIISLLETQTQNGKLYIGVKENYNLKNSKNIVVTVYFNKLTGIHLSGSGDIETSSTINNDCSISLNGSGDVKVPVNATNINVKLTGSGDITLTGNATNLNYTLTGSGDIHGRGLKSTNADVNLNGSGDISVVASNVLKGRISGSGDVSYGGSPAKKDLSVSGSGDFSSF